MSSQEGVDLHLRCIDPSKKLKEVLKKIHGAVYFSATLTPFQYYSRLTGTGGEASCLKLPSPFPQENLKVMALDIETTYAKRDKTLQRLVDSLSTFVAGRTGNYLVFFPSYQYMQKAHDLFIRSNSAIFAPMQSTGMSERDRSAFLRFFDAEHEHGMAAFAVMGGIFGEGIDLTGDKVIGVAIVGVGMPQLCLERNLIQQYHEQTDEPGYDFAYVIPGFNRVMQAVGRLIRNDADRGVVLLADRRFGWQKYEEMTPEWWQPVAQIRGTNDIEKAVKRFWDEY
jgi:DNA excision repair protein ERCC-2